MINEYNPLVSVIVASYGNAPYLDDMINSVLNQIYTNWELIIINDGSTDKTLEIAKKHKRVKVVTQSNKGLPEARNTAVKNSKGD